LAWQAWNWHGRLKTGNKCSERTFLPNVSLKSTRALHD
jgi:hypothetical protein